MSLIQQSHTQPATASRWLVLALAAMAAGLFTLDTSLNVIALPAIARSFGTSTAEVVWVTIGSQLVLLGLSLPIGSLADALGRRRLFTLGFGVFLMGLAGSYLSPTLPVLVGARIVQGLGLALFISTRNAIAVEGFPRERRGTVMGVIIGAVGIGSATGPLLGGFLLETWGWRVIYLAELPLTLVCGTMALVILRWERIQRLVDFDLRGTALALLGAASLLVAMNRLPSWGPSSPGVVLLAAGGLGLVLGFIWQENRAARPVLHLSLLRRRPLAAPSLVLFFQVTGHAIIMVTLPFFLVGALELRAATAGIIYATAPVMMFAGSVIGGPVSDRFGPTVAHRGSMVIATAGAALLVSIGADSSVLYVLAALALLGAGAGTLQTSTGGAILNAVPPQHLGMVSALFIAIIMLGGTLGGNLSGTLMAAVQPWAEATIGPGAAAIAAAYRPVAIVGAAMLAAGTLITLAPLRPPTPPPPETPAEAAGGDRRR